MPVTRVGFSAFELTDAGDAGSEAMVEMEAADGLAPYGLILLITGKG
jgi:hypothetical protein